MVRAKVISSLEKVFLRDTWDQFPQVRELIAARGERVSFQAVLENPFSVGAPWERMATVSVRSKLGKYIRSFCVEYVPSELPAFVDRASGEYLTMEPGMFPDVLRPIKKGEEQFTNYYSLKTFWFTAELPEDLAPGDYAVHITFKGAGNAFCVKTSVKLCVKNAVIPTSDLKFTQWFHCDSIADYFGVKMMSEKHWKLIDRFLATAAHTGIRMILTPLFTPPLDTAIGTERPTMQLVGVEKQGERYSFDFSLLDRWVALCHSHGIRYFELSHLFTQWGACATPKIVVKVDGREEKLFGWHVPSGSELYRDFLSQFLPALVEHLDKLGIRGNCYFHISDEPSRAPGRPDFDNYLQAKQLVKQYIGDGKILDALSQVDFYDNGLIEYPVAATNHIEPFLSRPLKERWCYYCCSQGQEVSNRFFAMPSYRNRVLGLQMYMNKIDGFLHWGHNFYYSFLSKKRIDPWHTTDAVHTFPSGDAFSVYPYENGSIESLRAVVFYQGLQDRMLLKALEAKLGEETVRAMVREIAGKEITFKECLDAATLTAIHDKAILLLAEN